MDNYSDWFTIYHHSYINLIVEKSNNNNLLSLCSSNKRNSMFFLSFVELEKDNKTLV